ncbi:flagellar biosynthesis protein FliQ [Vagococcus fluvialis]|jgi:flagellar biosynthetic protein FliQ|uniref:Flagellar biosynthetic protein FliQ n=1 Tax=Vagococcus fluvialis TaxID=2738 RepID=A0A369AVA6_9ENTE|nr:flagellar biosynthesis protein FliQ [Vagococcus fluvialis]MDR2278756.1 flagellar biosynthesis protein FliQ [Vagococcus sp.]OTP29636.1 flagellar biosynthetic protein FliQ [Enterococcus sp. 6C8_DIV0013]MBO0419204.1 flagellar biosynthesis protein FliQ [Vagococcus fluvialis]MBO0429042.1 flagellar biosynthesis protein FliQ [Vagococcus fluvialis]MBO0436770.1 flagellar biosynthesis protein FliQ [Vagococcus fluvialis]
MTIQMVLDVMHQAFLKIILIAGPILLVAMVVGLVISILQATTQIQEQTLSFVPKLLTVFISLIILGNFMLNVLIEFTKSLFKIMSSL